MGLRETLCIPSLTELCSRKVPRWWSLSPPPAVLFASLLRPDSVVSSTAKLAYFPSVWQMLFCTSIVYVRTKLLQSCLTLCHPMGYRPAGSSVQARILEWVAMPSSRGLFPIQEPVSPVATYIAGKFFTAEPLGEACTSL